MTTNKLRMEPDEVYRRLLAARDNLFYIEHPTSDRVGREAAAGYRKIYGLPSDAPVSRANEEFGTDYKAFAEFFWGQVDAAARETHARFRVLTRRLVRRYFDPDGAPLEQPLLALGDGLARLAQARAAAALEVEGTRGVPRREPRDAPEALRGQLAAEHPLFTAFENDFELERVLKCRKDGRQALQAETMRLVRVGARRLDEAAKAFAEIIEDPKSKSKWKPLRPLVEAVGAAVLPARYAIERQAGTRTLRDVSLVEEVIQQRVHMTTADRLEQVAAGIALLAIALLAVETGGLLSGLAVCVDTAVSGAAFAARFVERATDARLDAGALATEYLRVAPAPGNSPIDMFFFVVGLLGLLGEARALLAARRAPPGQVTPLFPRAVPAAKGGSSETGTAVREAETAISASARGGRPRRRAPCRKAGRRRWNGGPRAVTPDRQSAPSIPSSRSGGPLG